MSPKWGQPPLRHMAVRGNGGFLNKISGARKRKVNVMDVGRKETVSAATSVEQNT